MTEKTFILNRYLMNRQFETGKAVGNCRSSAATTNQQQHSAYDFNANECQLNSELFYDQSCLSPYASNDITASQPLSFIRKMDITESPNRSSFAKLPNCLRRKQLSIHKSKYVENQVDTKLTAVYKNGRSIDKECQPNFSTQRESVADQCSYRPNLIGPNSQYNEYRNGKLPVSAPLESTPSPKRIYDRLKRNHIRHIVRTTREKINQSLSSFKRSAKSRNQYCDEDSSKRGVFFNHSYSDSDLHLSVQQMIEEKSSQNFEHFIMNCDGGPKKQQQQLLPKLSRFSSVDNLFDNDFKDFEMTNYENELNHAKKSLFKTNVFRKQRLSSSKDDGLRWWQRQKTTVKSSTSSSSKSNSEGEYCIDHSPAHTNSSTDNGFETIPLQLDRADDSSFCAPHDVPDWNELCSRVYRFRIKPPNQTLNAIEPNSNLSTPPSLYPEKTALLNSTIETITPSCRQELFSKSSPTIISSTSSQPKCDTPSGSMLLPVDISAAPVEPKFQFDVKMFIGRVAKRIFALKENSSDRESFEKALEKMELTHLDDDVGGHYHLANQRISVRAYQTFLLDLCKEQCKCTFCTDPNCPSPHLSLMLPLRCQKRTWPQKEDVFVQALQKRVESLTVLKADTDQEVPSATRSAQHFYGQRKCAQEVKRFGLMAYCRKQRKMDLVDSVLYQEMVEDEHQWSLQLT